MTFINHLKGYSIKYDTPVFKDIKKLDKKTLQKIEKKLDDLVKGTQGLDIKKLSGYEKPTYRLRVNTYRIIYEVYEEKILVIVISISHRKNAYE